jgi:hypothetical protein
VSDEHEHRLEVAESVLGELRGAGYAEGQEPVELVPARVPRVATFFALYPETLGLNDGTVFCVALKAPLRGFARTSIHLIEGKPYWLAPQLSESLAVSVRFHRGKRSRDIVTRL